MQQKIYNKLKKITQRAFLDDDTIILASFPKSGSTWLRFILGNIYNTLEPEVDEINFHTIHNIIPDLDRGTERVVKDLPPLYKTHDTYSDSFNSAILIMRNPFDTIYSYYHYLNKQEDVEISLKEVVYHKRYGIKAIVAHTRSYVRDCDKLLIVTYESLHERPLKTIQKTVHFLGLTEANDTIISKAIERSSFNNMRKSETQKGRKFGKQNVPFTRSGKVGQGRQNMEQEEIDYILQEMERSPLLNLLYYNV